MQLNGKPLDRRDRILGRLEFWRRRPSSLGCNCVVARRRSLRFVAAAVLLLHRGRQASIVGIAEKKQRLRRIDFGWGKPRVGHEQLDLEFAIISLAADLAVAFPRKRGGRRDKAGPGPRSRLLDELVQLFGGDAAVARVQLGPGGRRGLIGRSRCPTRRCTGRSPRASAQNTKAHGGLGRRCIIDPPFRASPVNGKALIDKGN